MQLWPRKQTKLIYGFFSLGFVLVNSAGVGVEDVDVIFKYVKLGCWNYQFMSVVGIRGIKMSPHSSVCALASLQP